MTGNRRVASLDRVLDSLRAVGFNLDRLPKDEREAALAAARNAGMDELCGVSTNRLIPDA